MFPEGDNGVNLKGLTRTCVVMSFTQAYPDF